MSDLIKYVEGIGPSISKIAIVGDFPKKLGTDYLIEECISSAGLDPKAIYRTYAIKYPIGHPGNIAKFGINVEKCIEDLFNELRILDPNVIVVFNDYVLNLLCGVKGVSKYRGSILLSPYLNTKVIPTLHPESIFKDSEETGMSGWKDLTYIKWDFNRIREQSLFKEYNPPPRDLLIAKSAIDFYRFRERYASAKHVAVDIETFHTIPSCISFAFTKSTAISVPLMLFSDFQMTRSELVYVWKEVADLLADPSIMKIGQNFKFDEDKLHKCYDDKLFFGLRVRSFFHDTMLSFKTLYPELPSGLAFIASVFTEEPYYKEEGKGYNPKKDKADRLLLYNAKDSAITFECYERISEELQNRNLEDFFYQRIMPLHPFYLRMENRGLLVDVIKRDEIKKDAKSQLEKLQFELASILENFGVYKYNYNSPKQTRELIFGTLNIPEREKCDEKTLDALMRNTVKDAVKKRIIELILECRKVRKLIGTYIEAQTHIDGTIKTSYRLILETGRTSTSVCKPPITTETMGMALQTITAGHGESGKVGSNLRSIFIPNDEYIYVEPDLSQAEARVVAILANDPRLIKIFKYGVDIHRITAGWINNNSPNLLLEKFYNENDESKIRELVLEINSLMKKSITDEQRQLGKMGRHAGNYGIGKRTFSIQAKVSELLAGRVLIKFHETNPNIKKVFHGEIVDFLKNNNRELCTPFGRTRTFLNRWGDELFKEAYAYIPQSTVSDHLKFAMMRISKRCPELRFLLECHDSFLAEIRISQLTDRIYRIISEELETPIDFSSCSLTRGNLVIPCDIKVGPNWGSMEKVSYKYISNLIEPPEVKRLNVFTGIPIN